MVPSVVQTAPKSPLFCLLYLMDLQPFQLNIARNRTISNNHSTRNINTSLVLYVQLLKPSPLSCARIGGDLVWLQPEDDSEVTDYLVYLAQESWNQNAIGFYCHSLTDQWADSEHSAKWFVQQKRKKWRETRLEFYS